MTLAERLWAKVDRSGDCWVFTGYRDAGGYGSISRGDGRPISAHRASWIVTHGPIPTGALVCHTCDNPPCVRPDHLFLGDDQANAVDMVSKGRHRPRLGSTSPNAKLSEDAVRDIRRRGGSISDGALAAEYGVTDTVIFNVRHRRSWRHVE